jgi:hypothetical protein
MGAPASKKKIKVAIGIRNFYLATLCGTVAQVQDDNLPTRLISAIPACLAISVSSRLGLGGAIFSWTQFFKLADRRSLGVECRHGNQRQI